MTMMDAPKQAVVLAAAQIAGCDSAWASPQLVRRVVCVPVNFVAVDLEVKSEWRQSSAESINGNTSRVRRTSPSCG